MTASPNPATKRILIVDDDAGVVALMQRMLGAAGYVAEGAFDGDEGGRRFAESSWDLVILDRAMPGLSGEELAERIKHQVPAQPLIMITGLPRAVKHRQWFSAILEKPFRFSDLLHAVEQSLGKAK